MSTKTPAYDNGIDYFDMALQYEQAADKHFTDEVLYQIDARLGKNKIHHGALAGQMYIVEEKGQNMSDDGRNRFWYDWVNSIIKKNNRRKKMDMKQMNTMVTKLNSETVDETIFCFITLGFDDEKIACGVYEDHLKRLQRLCYTVSHLVFERGSIRKVEYVLEKHRATGIHHHAHFLFTFNSKVPPSTMINKIYAAKGVSEYVRDKNFVDYIGPQKPKGAPCGNFLVYFNYIHGNKREEKLSFVGKDREWRDKNNISHIYCV